MARVLECPTCGEPKDKDAKQCTSCRWKGVRVPCPKCGGWKHHNARMCRSCWLKLLAVTKPLRAERRRQRHSRANRDWYQRNGYDQCPTCSGTKTKGARRCINCARVGNGI